jgi:N-acetylmuramoyl-L-alanine amidase
MRPINLIVIHCSASPNDRTLFEGTPGKADFRNPAQVIDAWHWARGFHRADTWRQRQNPDLKAIGYHYVIGRNGAVFAGRHVDEIGAHAMGYNQKSIGICLVGIDAFSSDQLDSLAQLVTSEVARITGRNGPSDRNNPLARKACAQWAKDHGILICGHRDLPDVKKSCPGFDVEQWIATGGLS